MLDVSAGSHCLGMSQQKYILCFFWFDLNKQIFLRSPLFRWYLFLYLAIRGVVYAFLFFVHGQPVDFLHLKAYNESRDSSKSGAVVNGVASKHKGSGFKPMFSLCKFGFFLGALVSTHSARTCRLSQ